MMGGMRSMQKEEKRYKRILLDCFVTILILLSAAAVCVLLRIINDQDVSNNGYVSMVFVLAVLLVSRFTEGYVYGVFASFVSVLLVNFFFTFPYFAFNFSLPGYPVAIVCMLTVSLLTCTLTSQVKEKQEAQRAADREMIRSNLLRAISHDLRTPLTAILGANSAMMENAEKISLEQRLRLHEEINSDAQWLIRMVENLLTITRIRGDREAKIEKREEIVEEVIAEAVAKFQKRFSDRIVQVAVPEELLVCPMDALLVEQVILNLLENIVEHAETATQMGVCAQHEADAMRITVWDNGNGLPAGAMKQLFEDGGRSSFSESDSKRNMGIGLSVCDAIIRAHGGHMEAQHSEAGGLAVSFVLPMGEKGAEEHGK